MQSHLYFLRWGKPVLVRPCILGSAICKTFNSATRKPPYQTIWPTQQKRQSTTCDGYAFGESSLREAGMQKMVLLRPPGKLAIPKLVPRTSSIGSHRSRQKIASPSRLLGEYLDTKDSSERANLAMRVLGRLDPSRLPSLLLYHLHRTSNEGIDSTNQHRHFFQMAQIHMARKGFSMEDIAHWEWILSGEGPDAMVDRFFTTSTPKPGFLLLEILRRDIQRVESLHKILDHLMNMDMLAESSNSESDRDESASQLNTPVTRVESNAFEVLISRLLYQARRIWPAAMVSIAHMVEPHFSSVMNKDMSTEKELAKTARLSEILNYFLKLLSLPTNANPMASVRHNWEAQKVMLELAGKFDPPLTLSRSSYRSIVRVLASTRKSDNESKSATLRNRSWPPWRHDQDGMDARRTLEEDFSRVILAMFKSQEAGYRQGKWDDAMGIYGGMEPDGTPSIQTRRSLRKPRGRLDEGNKSNQVWAARIEATRDVQEAWSAFHEFKTGGGTPNQAMFLAMFEKLNYDLAISRKRPYTAPPGDGKEVLAVSNDNYTEYYIAQFHHPSLSVLYKEMLELGIRPSGRCLKFLIRKARTTDEGLRYLLDAGFDKMAVRLLAEGSSSTVPVMRLAQIPDAILCAYIDLTCRLAARAVAEYKDRRSFPEDSLLTPRFTFAEADTSGETDGSSNWTVVYQRPTKARHDRTRATYRRVEFLLKSSSTIFKPTWYAYFRALARHGAVIAREVVGNAKQDSLAWHRISQMLKAFESLGLELEPEGFYHICVGFEKFAGGGLGKFSRYRKTAQEQCKIVRNAFAKVSKTQNVSKDLPRLFYTFRGVHLHAYIRAIGAVDDYEGIMSALKWMVENNEELQAIAHENRNGVAGFQKTIVAIRYLLEGSPYAEQARELATKVVWWGDWPSDEAVISYLRGSDNSLNEEDEAVTKDPSGADWE